VLLASPAARAWHTDEQRMVDGHAYTLGKRKFRLGIWTFEYGLLERLDLATWTLPWIARIANAGAKYELRINDKLSLGTALHAFRFDLRNVKPDAPRLVVTSVPWETTGSYRFNSRWTASLQTLYTYVQAEGELKKEELHGAAALSNLQLVSTLEHRFSQALAGYVRVRYVAYQWPLSASAKVVSHPDEYTTVTVVGTGRANVFDVRRAWSLVPGVAWSWRRLNLRMGVGYGNLNLPGVNVVVERKTVVPEFDLFWIW
jgi:hypothetical protein